MALRTGFVSRLAGCVLFFAVSAGVAQAGALTIDDRVRAQEAIDRVYHSHQIGKTAPFDEAVTRDLLERKVRTYLRQSVALRELWDTPITNADLEREWDRIVRETKYPDRLRQIADALGWDPVLLLECLARPTLVDRLLGEFYSRDERLHAATRKQAERVQALLGDGEFEAAASLARTHQVLLTRAGGKPARDRATRRAASLGAGTKPEVVVLDAGTYRARRSRAPEGVGQVGRIIEGRGAFEIRVVLDESEDHARIASYFVPKKGRDVWWREVRGLFDGVPVRPSREMDAEAFRTEAQRMLGFAGAFDPSCLPDDTWDNGILEDPNPAREGHSAVWTGTEMIVWGGGGLNSGLRYDPLLDVFTPTSRVNAPTPRSFHSAVWSGTEMLVWGGWPLNAAGGRYDPAQDSWTAMDTAGAPSARFDHTAVWTGYAMIVWGGTDGTVALGDGARYFPDANAWIPTNASLAPGPRARHSAVWTGTEMIVWGGLASDYLSDGSRYEPIQDRWTATPSAPAPVQRADHIAVWTGSQMIVWGGANQGGPLSQGRRYDPEVGFWFPISTTGAPTVGDGEVAVWTGDELLVWRGTGAGDQAKYDPDTNSWSAMSSGPDAPPASLASAVWTGDSMIVWSPADGGRYDPQSDGWTATDQLAATPGPSDRSGHTAVWTGSHMIVWGGPAGASPVGSRYDPLLESWTPVATLDAPAVRTGHTAVWTGDRMIVWGGDAAGSLQDTGGLYDPIGDSWQATASIDAPQARDEHSAVWTGTEMLIWGGYVGGDSSTQVGCEAAYTATGSAYDPVGDGWSAIPAGSASGRGSHTAVWTGSEMLVWGGRHWIWDSGGGTCIEDVAVTDGARHDFAGGSWTSIGATDEPAARFDHTAVWTGDAMVVWGGTDGTTMLGTGGRYFPATDSWSPTTLDGAPAPRARHTAIWTGGEMVVWGGGSYLRDGSRYQPDWDIWRTTTLAGTPAARDGHTAVWTGDLMVVWGGSEPMGGRYALGHPDNDGDGIADGCLACPDGPGDDADGDGVACASDNCPFDPNPTQGDEDADGWGDECDPCLGDATNDADYDLVCHSADNCAGAYNPAQADADGDGAGDVCDTNDDLDSHPDAVDNCPTVSNEGQADSDGDGAGDACDPCVWDAEDDVDGDGSCGNVDNCPTTSNPTQDDSDHDGTGDACDICPSDSQDNVIGDGMCFGPEALYPVNRVPYSISSGDFNGDGSVDLVTTNRGFSDYSTLLNNGDGTFGTATTGQTGTRPVFSRAADLNGDGISDFVAIITRWDPMNPGPGAVAVFIGSPSGFEPGVEYTVGHHPRTVAIDDFDGDGVFDLVVANRETNDLSFLRGTTFGTFYAEIPFTTVGERRPEHVTSGDFDNDQMADLAVSITDDDILQIYLSRGGGNFSFAGEGEIGTDGTIYSHTAGDFNEDGNVDLAVSHASDSYNLVTLLTGDGTGQFFFNGDFDGGTRGESIQVADFNRDGHQDLVMTNFDIWDISILTGDGNAGLAGEVRLPVGPRPTSVAVPDLTDDGRDGLAVSNSGVDTVSVRRNLGPFGPSAPVADAGFNGIWIVPTDSPTGATVFLDGSGSTDRDSTPGTANDIVLYEWYEDFGRSGQAYLGVGKTLNRFFTIGGHRLTLRVTDKTGRSDIDLVTVTVMQSDLLPDLTIDFTPPTLWPPNHRLVDVQANVIPGPGCDSPSAILGSISSTEAHDAAGLADGDTSIDIQDAYPGIVDLQFQLRAERSSLATGRTYYVTYIASCSPGNVKPLLYSFTIPHEKNGTAEPMRIVLDETMEGTLVAWSPVTDAQDYDVIRGSLDQLQVLDDAYDLGDVICVEANSTDESTAGFEDPAEPSAGDVYFYLVQYRGDSDSGYGTESVPKPRVPGDGDCP